MQQHHHTHHPLIRIREHLLDVCYILAFVGFTTFKRTTRTPQVGVRALVLRQGHAEEEVLLVRHRLIFFPWSLPGGTVGRQEPLATTVEREVHEEAGCRVRVRQLHGLFRVTSGGLDIHTVVFVCDALSDAHPPEGDIEIVDAQFFPLRALPQYLERGSRQRIAEYLNAQSNIVAMWHSAEQRYP
jgi:ADP-ribose pyrophosphatase YjhB (NUDIX family)